MKIDLDELQQHCRMLVSGEIAASDAIQDAAPILVEAFSVLAHAVSIGEVVLPARLDGTPASAQLQEALGVTAAQADETTAVIARRIGVNINVSEGITPQLDPAVVRARDRIDLDELERIACAAHQQEPDATGWHIVAGDGAEYGSAVAAHVEANAPPVTLALIERIRDLEAGARSACASLAGVYPATDLIILLDRGAVLS